jgi:hypothetical protein
MSSKGCKRVAMRITEHTSCKYLKIKSAMAVLT